MEQLLKDNGYRQIQSCSCGGLPQRKYHNHAYPAYKIVVFYTRGTFHILNYNVDIASGSSTQELAAWLDKIKEKYN